MLIFPVRFPKLANLTGKEWLQDLVLGILIVNDRSMEHCFGKVPYKYIRDK